MDRASKQNSDSDKVEVALGILGGSSVLLLITTILLIVMVNNRSQRQKSNASQNEGSLFTLINIFMASYLNYIMCALLFAT